MRKVLGVAACVAISACMGDGASFKPLTAGDRVPEYGARSLAGDSVDLGQLRGRPFIVNLWATWCGPCRDEMPELQELSERYEGSLEVIGVSIDMRGAEALIEGFLEDVGVDFEILLDPEQRVVRSFTTVGVPETFLIDAAGIVRHRWIGRFFPFDSVNIALIEDVLDDA